MTSLGWDPHGRISVLIKRGTRELGVSPTGEDTETRWPSASQEGSSGPEPNWPAP